MGMQTINTAFAIAQQSTERVQETMQAMAQSVNAMALVSFLTEQRSSTELLAAIAAAFEAGREYEREQQRQEEQQISRIIH